MQPLNWKWLVGPFLVNLLSAARPRHLESSEFAEEIKSSTPWGEAEYG